MSNESYYGNILYVDKLLVPSDDLTFGAVNFADQCNVVVTTYNCSSSGCVPVNGSGGTFATLGECEAACVSYNCVNGNCVSVPGTGGNFSTLSACQSSRQSRSYEVTLNAFMNEAPFDNGNVQLSGTYPNYNFTLRTNSGLPVLGSPTVELTVVETWDGTGLAPGNSVTVNSTNGSATRSPYFSGVVLFGTPERVGTRYQVTGTYTAIDTNDQVITTVKFRGLSCNAYG